MTPEEKAEYRKKVQAIVQVDETVTVTGADEAPKVVVSSSTKKKAAKKSK